MIGKVVCLKLATRVASIESTMDHPLLSIVVNHNLPRAQSFFTSQNPVGQKLSGGKRVHNYNYIPIIRCLIKNLYQENPVGKTMAKGKRVQHVSPLHCIIIECLLIGAFQFCEPSSQILWLVMP